MVSIFTTKMKLILIASCIFGLSLAYFLVGKVLTIPMYISIFLISYIFAYLLGVFLQKIINKKLKDGE